MTNMSFNIYISHSSIKKKRKDILLATTLAVPILLSLKNLVALPRCAASNNVR